jgi:hypothetical protein
VRVVAIDARRDDEIERLVRDAVRLVKSLGAA